MSEPIQARLAMSVSLPEGLPAEIQWMPPGTHKITAMRGDKPVEMTVRADEATARAVQAQLQVVRSKAAAGHEDRPYIDFNHEDGPASGHITDVFWAGEDPVKGGVRAKVEWTEPGKAALTGKAYRRFSPSFFPDADGGVIGTPLNMGGLVNRAAFKTIAPIWSHAAAEGPTQSMDNTKELADLKTAVQAKDAELATLKSQVEALKSDQTVKAKDAEIAALNAKITDLNTKLAVQAKAAAEATVEAAVKAGKIAPQATEVRAKWVALLTQDPESAKLLDAMPVTAALGTVVTGANGGPAANSSGATPAEQFVAAVKAKEAELKSGKSAALNAVIHEKPDLYKAWRDANGKPGL